MMLKSSLILFLEDATIGEKAAIGPFSRLRPGAELAGRNPWVTSWKLKIHSG